MANIFKSLLGKGARQHNMKYISDVTVKDFINVVKKADNSINIKRNKIEVESLRPRQHPTELPQGMMAVYVFFWNKKCLKVGKAGPKSQSRYFSQHYNPSKFGSTLVNSIFKDEAAKAEMGLTQFKKEDIGCWIKNNTYRFNFLIPKEYGKEILAFLEAFLQLRFRPRFEGRS